MKRICLIFVLFSLIIFSFNSKAEDAEQIMKLLTSSDMEQKSLAVKEMLQSNNESYYFLLNALLENNLYTYSINGSKPKLVVPVNKEGTEKYILMEGYPRPEILKSGNSEVIIPSLESLTEVKLSRPIRNFIQQEATKIQLHHWDKQKKILAIRNAASAGNTGFIAVFRKMKEKEKSEEVGIVLKDAIFQLMLQSPIKKVRIEAIEGLGASEGGDALSILRNHLESNEKEANVKKLTFTVLEKIESRNQKKEIVQNLFTGISLGSVLILMALGLAIIYGLMGIINMAHGEFMMIGAYTTFIVQSLFTTYLPYEYFAYYFWIALPCSFIVSGLIGVLVEVLIIKHLYNRPLESLLATWGVSLILIQSARSLFGDLTSVKAPAFATGGLEIMPQLVLPYSRLFIIILTVVVVLIVRYLLMKTSFGLKIRAVTQNKSMSACLGIPTEKVNRSAFFLGTGIAGIAGWALTLISNVVPNMGQTYIVDSFLVVVTGGVGKLAGTVLSGLGMGFTTKLLEPIFQAVYGKVIILILVILFLQIKPTGLFPAKGRSEE